MNRGIGYTMAAIAAAAPVAAEAGARIILQPVQLAQESVRFDRGDFVVDQASTRAAVQVRPASDDHGQMSFVVTVMNTGPAPINVDVTDMRIEGTEEPVRLVTRMEMEQKAKRRAGWANFANIVGSAFVAAGQAGQREHYTAVTQSRFGTFRTNINAPCYSCQAAANQTMADAGVRMAQIREALDSTRDALREQAFQLTTIDPGQYFGGRIYLSKFKPKSLAPVRLVMTVGEEAFTFAFRFAPDGSPMPQYRMVTAALPAATAAAQPGARLIPAVVPATPARNVPVRVAFASTPAAAPVAVNGGVRAKWQRYYTALLDAGTSRSQARSMANEQFGAID